MKDHGKVGCGCHYQRTRFGSTRCAPQTSTTNIVVSAKGHDGVQRPHWKGSCTAQWAMNADLSGPHPTALGTSCTYLLVAVVTTNEKGIRLPFTKGLSSKKGDDVARAISSILVELKEIVGYQAIVRFHSDAGGEFTSAAVQALLRSWHILQTTTAGNDPKANGLAERYVGIIKGRATAYLTHTELPLELWYWACMQASYVYRTKMLGAPLPLNAPTFGERVLVRNTQGEATFSGLGQNMQRFLHGAQR